MRERVRYRCHQMLDLGVELKETEQMTGEYTKFYKKQQEMFSRTRKVSVSSGFEKVACSFLALKSQVSTFTSTPLKIRFGLIQFIFLPPLIK